MSAPALLVIGDSFPFRADNVMSGRDDAPLPSADVSYKLLDLETRDVVAEGDMSLYDAPSASFEAVIDDSELTAYDPDTNPDGIKPEHEYVLRVTVDNNGTKTSKVRRLVAKLDPPDEEDDADA